MHTQNIGYAHMLMQVKPSAVSTAQLNASQRLHLRPIKQLVSLRPYLR